MYSLNPSEDLKRVRAQFGDYEICEFHDEITGRPNFTAVLKPPYRDSGLAILLTDPSPAGLADKLHAQGPPPLPQRQLLDENAGPEALPA